MPSLRGSCGKISRVMTLFWLVLQILPSSLLGTARISHAFLQTTTAVVPTQGLTSAPTPSASARGSAYRRQNRKVCIMSVMSTSKSKAAKLRELLSGGKILVMPCCYDGLTARLVEDAGFPLTFMTGFGVSGAHGLPDTQASSQVFGPL